MTMGLSQSVPLSPVLYNVYTNGLWDLNSNGLSRVLTLAEDGQIYKTSSDIHTAVTAVQEQLVLRDRVRNQFKQGTGPVVHP